MKRADTVFQTVCFKKQWVGEPIQSVSIQRVNRSLHNFTCFTEVFHRIAHVVVQMTRSTLVSSRYFTDMLELSTSNTCIIQVFPTTEEIKYKQYCRVQRKHICSVSNPRYHCSMLQEC